MELELGIFESLKTDCRVNKMLPTLYPAVFKQINGYQSGALFASNDRNLAGEILKIFSEKTI